jgi:hypothetical protein
MDLLLLALELGIGVWCNWTIAALICWLVLTLFAQEVAINLAEVFGVVFALSVHFILNAIKCAIWCALTLKMLVILNLTALGVVHLKSNSTWCGAFN